MNNVVYISIGSNQGEREKYLHLAVTELDQLDNITVEKVSSIYETEPVDYLDQPRFLNMVVKITTSLSPTELLQVTQMIENKGERTRSIRFGPRTLDLDILLYNQENIKLSYLQIPHPRMLERAFVMIPLIEIAPSLILPDGSPIDHIYEQLSGKEGVTLWKTYIELAEGLEPFEN